MNKYYTLTITTWSLLIVLTLYINIPTKEYFSAHTLIPYSLVWLLGITAIVAYSVYLDKNNKKRKIIEDKLRQAATLFDNTDDNILITDKNINIVAVNKKLLDTTGFNESDLKGKEPSFLQSYKHCANHFHKLKDILAIDNQWQGEIWIRQKYGDHIPTYLKINQIKNDARETVSYIWIYKDISQSLQWKETFHKMSHYDYLTTLPNRLLLTARLDHALDRSRRNKSKVAIIFLDLDRFKYINDSLGHDVGDKVLQEIACRLEKDIRKQDTLSRLGGDEFAIMVEDIRLPEQLGRFSKKLINKITLPVLVNDYKLHLTTSIGISISPDDGATPSELISNAEAAMFQAKEEKRNNFKFYTSDLTKNVRDKIKHEDKLYKALDNDEFIPYFQPQVSLATEEVIGFEALARWHNSTKIILAENFIQLATDSGLIVRLSEQILRKSCQQMQKWLSTGEFFGKISVNISGKQIQYTKLPQIVASVLEETGCPPEHLKLEVTEDFILHQNTNPVDSLNELRDLGVTLSIDDFGTGYSSLRNLKNIPVDQLKIDKFFIRDLLEDKQDQSIILAIISLGHNLGIEVVAEGVENKEQLEFLKQASCCTCQGYYYSKALPGDKVSKWLTDWNKTNKRFSN